MLFDGTPPILHVEVKMESVGTPTLWIGFSVLVVGILAIDLGAFHKKAHAVRFGEAVGWTLVWVSLAAFFGTWIYFALSPERALEFAAAYLVEEALSVDNLFVFLVIFRAFAIPKELQHRVLFWGILGALILRAMFIFVGAALLQAFHGVMYIFGAILVLTAIRLVLHKEENLEPEHSWVVRLCQKFMPITQGFREERFFVIENGKRFGTPLLIALLTVEVSDVLFAVDSIPAVFAVSQDPFIVYTSNIFAIMGLRSLYFLLAGVMERFEYLKYGLALVLAFVGAKLLLSEIFPISIQLSLTVIASVITLSVLFSMWMTRRAAPRDP